MIDTFPGFLSLGLKRALAVLLLALVALGVAAYPFARVELGIGLALFGAAVYWRPTSLGLLLPPWLTLVNLAPWSGSLYLEDYDLVLGMSVAVLLARGLYASTIRLTKLQWWMLGFLVCSYSISTMRGLWPIPAWDPVELSTYYSRWHALRLGKGFFWALLLLPGLVALLRFDHKRTRQDLAWGLALAGLAIGLVAMWERGVIAAIADWHGHRDVVNALLDFSRHYRVTGIFSEMHTGGEAIDGFIALVWPFGVLAALGSRSRWGVVLGAISLASVLYAGVTTFSRVTYVAMLVGFVASAALWLYTHKGAFVLQRFARWDAAPGMIAPLLMIYLYTRGGYGAMVAGLLGWGASMLLGHAYPRAARQRRYLIAALLLLSASASALGMYRSLVNSVWIDNPPSHAFVLSLASALLSTVGGGWSGMRLATAITAKANAMIVALLMGAVGIMTPAAMGSYMSERTAGNEQDFATRMNHWKHAIDLMPSDWATTLFGVGIGTFPASYLWSGEPPGMGSYRFVPAGSDYLLRLGGGQDARLTQRLSLPAYGRYTLSMDVSTGDPKVWLRARLYRRNMILMSDHPGDNVTLEKHVTDTQGSWQRLSWTFNLGALGEGGAPARTPLLLELMNFRKYDFINRPGTLIDVDNVSIKDESGREYLANGDFREGLTRWFPHYDFNHLPWHVKNLWVNLLFDQGVFGLMAFMGFLGSVLHQAVGRARANDAWGVAVSAAVASYLAVGVFGGLLDMPRIIFIAWLMLFLTALTGPARLPKG